jgi:hypothetical protein
LDVARLCYAHASEFEAVHHWALMIIVSELLISEGIEELSNG